MTLSIFPSRRVTGGVAAVALAATGAVGAGVFSPASADQALKKNFDYTCVVVAGGLDLGEKQIGVTASTTVPDSVAPGDVIAPTPVSITLTMPEVLRSSTASLLGGREASGSSTDSAVTVTTAGETTTVPIPDLSAPRTAIPQGENEPWLIPATGMVPSITTPANAAESVVVGMPKAFNVTATIYKADDSTIPATLACKGPADLALGSIAVTAAPTTEPTAEPTTEPTAEPTTEPTTEPTAEPTTEPTAEPTTEPTAEPTAEPTTEPTTEPTAEPTTEPTTTPPAEDVALSKSFPYECGVIAAGLDLGPHKIGVLAETSVPGSVRPGDQISERPVSITLTMPEVLRNSTVGLLKGRAADGGSTDSAITLSSAGETMTVKIPNLVAPRTDIPQDVAPWLIPAEGTVPAITVPATAKDSAVIGMPAAFNVAAKIYTDTAALDASLACKGPSDLTLGTVTVAGGSTTPTDGPTTPALTDGPTTPAPTDGPTTPAPTDGPTTPAPTQEPGDGGESAVELISSDVVAPGDAITFSFADKWIGKTVRFELRSKAIDLGTRVVNAAGEASVRIPRNAPAGSHTVRIYSSSGALIGSVPIEIEAADGGAAAGGDSAGGTDGVLASAGGPAVGAGVLGGVLLLAGVGVIALRRRVTHD